MIKLLERALKMRNELQSRLAKMERDGLETRGSVEEDLYRDAMFLASAIQETADRSVDVAISNMLADIHHRVTDTQLYTYDTSLKVFVRDYCIFENFDTVADAIEKFVSKRFECAIERDSSLNKVTIGW